MAPHVLIEINCILSEDIDNCLHSEKNVTPFVGQIMSALNKTHSTIWEFINRKFPSNWCDGFCVFV